VSKEDAVVRRYGNIKDRYYNDPRILGSGIPGTSVRECINRLTGQSYAVKSIHKGADPAVNPDCIFREVEHLQEMQYRIIVRLVDVCEDGDCIHLVTDLCTGGELFDRIVERASPDRRDGGGGGGCAPCFAEDDTARVIHQVLGAVSYMHSLDIAHMDIKPENILFETTDGDSPVKIIDFGLSRRHCGIVERPVSSDVVGSPYYIAPEVLARRYGKSCDLWSVGVIVYILLAGYSPFNGSSNDEVHDAVRLGRYRFDPNDWSGVSVEAMDFIHRLLQLDPRKHMTAQQSLHHPWMVRHGLCTEDDCMMKEKGQVFLQDKSCTDFVCDFLSYM
jgi:serine/threonine protein kinase